MNPTETQPPQFATPSGIEVQRYYGPDTVTPGDLGRAGEYPFTRGIQKTMYRGRLWTMRQYAGFGTASETNGRFRYLLEQGQTGLSVAFDLPTQMGYDSDAPLAKDIRVVVRERIAAGDSDDEVIAFIVARYGSFVLLRPPVESSTIVLWVGPVVLLLAALGLAAWYMRRLRASAAPVPLSAQEEEAVRRLIEDERA